MEATAWATPTTPWLPPLLLPAMPASPPPPPSTSLASPPLPPPPSLEATLLPDATSPTLPELSTSPRGRLRLMPRLTPMCCTVLTTVWDTLDTPDTVVLATDTLDSDPTPVPTLLPPLLLP